MIQLPILPLLVLTLLIGNPAVAADFKEGLSAYNKGDFATALREWKPLAENKGLFSFFYSNEDIANSQYNLGWMYSKGQGVPQNDGTALRWYKLAAERGISLAQNYLGNTYRTGEGVPQNYKIAFKWYMLAAEQGSAAAQHKLGTMYAKGQGTLQEYTLSHMWFNIAISLGYEGARNERDIVEKKMSPTQIMKAQNFASKCIENNYKRCDENNPWWMFW